MARPFKPRFEPYDPDAKDGDGDGIVQEGTIWERPAGTKYLDAEGNPVKKGTSGTLRPPGAQLVDKDNKPVNYTPSTEQGGVGRTAPPKDQSVLGQQVEGTTPLSEHGAPSLRDLGLASVRQIIAGPPPEEPPEKEKPEPPKPPKVPRSETPERPTEPEPTRYEPKDPKRVSKVMYHATSSLKNLLSILRNGLRVNTPGADAGIGEEERAGVYLAETLDEALEYGRHIVAVAVDDLSVDSDPGSGHLVSRTPIPANKLRRVWDLDEEEKYAKEVEKAWRSGLPYPDPPEDRTVPENQLQLFPDPPEFTLADVVTAQSVEAMGVDLPTPPRRPWKPSPLWASGRAADLAERADGDIGRFAELLEKEGYVVFDYETTGLGEDGNMPVQVAMIRYKDGKIVARETFYMNPGTPLGEWARSNLINSETGEPLTDDFLLAQMSLREAHQRVADFVGGSILVAHNMPFDGEVLRRMITTLGLNLSPEMQREMGSQWLVGTNWPFNTIDSLELLRKLVPRDREGKTGPRGHGLNVLSEFFQVVNDSPHEAESDVLATQQVLVRALRWAAQQSGRPDIEDILNMAKQDADADRAWDIYQEELEEFAVRQEQYLNELARVQHALATGNEAKTPNEDRKGIAPNFDEMGVIPRFGLMGWIDSVDSADGRASLSTAAYINLVRSWLVGKNVSLDTQWNDYVLSLEADGRSDEMLTRSEWEKGSLAPGQSGVAVDTPPELISDIQIFDEDGNVETISFRSRNINERALFPDTEREQAKALLAAKIAAKMKSDLSTFRGATYKDASEKVLLVNKSTGELSLWSPGTFYTTRNLKVVDPATPGYQTLRREAVISQLIGAWAEGASGNRSADQMQLAAISLFGLTDADEDWIDDQRLDVDPDVETYREFLQVMYDDTQRMFAANGIRELVLFRGETHLLEDPFDLEETGDVAESVAGEITDASVAQLDEFVGQILDEALLNGTIDDILIDPADLVDRAVVQGEIGELRLNPFYHRLRPLSSWASTEEKADLFTRGQGREAGVIIETVMPVEKILSSAGTGNGCLNEDEFVVLGHVVETELVTDEQFYWTQFQRELGLKLISRWRESRENPDQGSFFDEEEQADWDPPAWEGGADDGTPKAANGQNLGYIPAEPEDEGEALDRSERINASAENATDAIRSTATSYLLGLTDEEFVEASRGGAQALSEAVQRRDAEVRQELDDVDLDPDDLVDSALQDVVDRAREVLADLNSARLMFATDPLALVLMIRDGRYKSQFETATSFGAYSPSSRRASEQKLLGVPPDLPDELRPVYGFPHMNDDSPLDTDVADAYGGSSVVIELRDSPSVKSRTTVTFADSLSSEGVGVPIGTDPRYMEDEEVLGWIDNPHDDFLNFVVPVIYESLQKNGANLRADQQDVQDRYLGAGDYNEIQVHGGFSLDDVAAVHVDLEQIDPETLKIFKDSGLRIITRNGFVYSEGKNPEVLDPFDDAPKVPVITLADLPPSRELGESGDGMITLPNGRRLWGRFGAAGLLVRHTDSDGTVRYFMQQRGEGVQLAGTWSVPGGAMYELETADEGAVREFVEEAGSLPVGRVVGRHVAEQGDGAWAYTTVIYEVDEQFEPDENWESSGGRWLTVDEVAELDLHPGFASAWPVLRDGGDPVEEEPFDLFEDSPDDAPAWEGGDLPDPTEKAITEPSDPTGSEKDLDDLMKEQWGDHRKRLYEWMMTTGVDPLSGESFLLAGGTEGDRESVYTTQDYEFPSGFSSLEEAVTESDERVSGPLLKKFTARLLAQKLLDRGIKLSDYQRGELWFYPLHGRFFVSTTPPNTYLSVVKVSRNDPNYEFLFNTAVADSSVSAWAGDPDDLEALAAQVAIDQMFNIASFGTERKERVTDEEVEVQKLLLEEMYRQSQSLLGNKDSFLLARGMSVEAVNDPAAVGEFQSFINEHFVEEMGDDAEAILEMLTSDTSLLKAYFSAAVDSDTLSSDLLNIPYKLDFADDRGIDPGQVVEDIFNPFGLDETLPRIFATLMTAEEYAERLSAQKEKIIKTFRFIQRQINDKPRNNFDPDRTDLTVPVTNMTSKSLSSFASSGAEAFRFSNRWGLTPDQIAVRSYHEVPVERILSTPGSGFGCFHEEEMVLVGGGDISGKVTLTFHVRNSLEKFIQIVSGSPED